MNVQPIECISSSHVVCVDWFLSSAFQKNLWMGADTLSAGAVPEKSVHEFTVKVILIDCSLRVKFEIIDCYCAFCCWTWVRKSHHCSLIAKDVWQPFTSTTLWRDCTSCNQDVGNDCKILDWEETCRTTLGKMWVWADTKARSCSSSTSPLNGDSPATALRTMNRTFPSGDATDLISTSSMSKSHPYHIAKCGIHTQFLAFFFWECALESFVMA